MKKGYNNQLVKIMTTIILSLIVVSCSPNSYNPPSNSYIEEPVITGINPSSAPVTGGIEVAVTGKYLNRELEIYIGENKAEITKFIDNKLFVMLPESKEVGNFKVTIGKETQESNVIFTYYSTPRIVKVSPSTGIAGTHVTIHGVGFLKDPKVYFNDKEAKVIQSSETILKVEAPQEPIFGNVSVKVENFDGESFTIPNSFKYIAKSDGIFKQLGPVIPNINGKNITDVIAIGDIDRNETLDIVTLNNNRPHIYLNNKNGYFEESRKDCLVTDENLNYKDAQFTDIDEDGYLDIVIIGTDNSNTTLYVYTNNRLGCFTKLFEFTRTGVDYDIEISDFNLDGRDDITVVGTAGVKTFINNQNLGFKEFTYTNATGSKPIGENGIKVQVEDLNGDNNSDMIIATSTDIKYYIYNNNTWIENKIYKAPNSKYGVSDVEFEDINQDGYTDTIALLKEESINGIVYNYIKIYINELNYEDSQNFVEQTPENFPEFSAYKDIEVGDIDNDGDLDIITLGNDEVMQNQTSLYVNTGEMNFAGYVLASVEEESNCFTNKNSKLYLADLDENGYLDILITNSNLSDRIYLNHLDQFKDKNNPSAVASAFIESSKIILPSSLNKSNDVVAEDINDDGYPDIIFSVVEDKDKNNSLTEILFSNIKSNEELSYNEGNFLTTPFANESSKDLELLDIDNNGYLDMLISTTGCIEEYINIYSPTTPNSKGKFSKKGCIITDEKDFHTLVTGDLNGDGFKDLIALNNTSSHIFLNNQRGEFLKTKQTLFSTKDAKGTLTDIDMDGDLDFVVVGKGLGSIVEGYIYYNNQKGEFTGNEEIKVDSYDDLNYTGISDMEMGDIDGDYDQDMIISYYIGTISYTWTLINKGEGKFEITSLIPPVLDIRVSDLNLADIDGNGTLDLLVAYSDCNTQYGSSIKLYRNINGKGEFDNVSPEDIGYADEVIKLYLTDLDKDGDLDIVTANYGQNRIYINN